LVFALIFLLVLTMLGVASLMNNTSQERMNYAVTDYTRAFQAADSAVTQGEEYISAQPSFAPLTCATPTSGCNVWSTLNSDNTLLSSSFWSSYGMNFGLTYNVDGSTTSRSNSGLLKGNGSALSTPQYAVEYIGHDDSSLACGKPNPPPIAYYYRITGRGAGAQSQMSATTQSTFVWYFPPPC
jgi:type IV pilus assembly protein PilX